MKKILVTYDSGYGATAAAAKYVAEALAETHVQTDLRPALQQDLSGYDAIFLGSPIRLGRCTPMIKRFVHGNLNFLASRQVALFFTCMAAFSRENGSDWLLYVDPLFDAPGRPPARFGFMEENHAVSYYLDQFLKLAPGVRPVGVAFFKGCLRMADLNPMHRLIMRLAKFALPEIKDGDFLNPATVRAWALGLKGALN